MTNREYKDLPSSIRVGTAFGDTYFNPTSADHIYIRGACDEAGRQLPLVVNGCDYNVSFHAHKREDGSWGSKDAHSLYASRVGRFDDPSPSARKKLIDELSRIASIWASTRAGKRTLAQAEWHRLENEALAKLGKIEELQEQLKALQGELGALNTQSTHAFLEWTRAANEAKEQA